MQKSEVENKIFKNAFEDEKDLKKFVYELIKYEYEVKSISKDFHKKNYNSFLVSSYIYFLMQILKYPTKAFFQVLTLKLNI